MICHRDRTFCLDKQCKDKDTCPLFLTKEIEKEAETFGLPVCVCERLCKEGE